jgi:hypothetical protein
MKRRASPATDAELQRVCNLAASGLSLSQIAREVKRPQQTVGGWLAPNGLIPQRGIKPGDVQGEFDAIRANLEERVRDVEAQLASVHRENLTARSIRGMISNIGENLPPLPKWPLEKGKPGSLGIPILHLSDWHIGEVVSLAQTGGVNEFNLSIAQQRVKTLVSKVISLSYDYHKNPHYPGIVVCLGGDMISGLIHQELVETMEGPFAGQLLETFALIGWALEKLAGKFGRVFVVGVVGNHGRLWHKPRAKNRAFDSFEYFLYCFLEARFCPRDKESGKPMPGYDERFSFHIAEDTDAYFDVAGWRFLLTHGDSTGAKGGDGFIGALGPIVRGEKKVREASSYVSDEFDFCLMGHYHVSVDLDRVYVNPTLKGYDEYAKNILRARPEPAAQQLLFVHPDHGVIDRKRIFLQKRPQRGERSREALVVWKDAA